MLYYNPLLYIESLVTAWFLDQQVVQVILPRLDCYSKSRLVSVSTTQIRLLLKKQTG